MSRTSGSRAAAFTHQSQSVEVSVDGAWSPGSILGWRHDADGSCEVWVRATVGGAEREIWASLADLRLPGQGPAVAVAPGVGPGASAASTAVDLGRAAARERLVAGVLGTPELSPAGVAGQGRRRRRHGVDVTAEMPSIGRGLSGRHRPPAGAGRHRAAGDETRVALQAAAVPPRPDVDCLTRPLRLGERVSRPRLPRPGGVVRA